MDGQDDGKRKKPHGNPNPKRGEIKKIIIRDWIGKAKPPTTTGPGGGEDNGNGGGGDNGNGGGGDNGGSCAGGYGPY